jgi:hypothetical protein
VHDFWSSTITQQFANLRLEEREVVQIEPFIPGKRSQKAKAGTVETLDFCVHDANCPEGGPLFFIEMKAGPGSVHEMREFQLVSCPRNK